MGSILVIEPDSFFSTDIGMFFGSLGHSIFQATDMESALHRFEEHDFDAIIGNVKMLGDDIGEFITEAKVRNNDAAVIVYTEADNVQDGLEAVRGGAFSFLQRPFSLPELNFQLRRALVARQDPKATPPSIEGEVYQPYNFIGESPAIKNVFKMVNRVAKADVSVIILGDTGTGKELVAGAIHYNSLRAAGPLVRVNCAALPEQLLESELFGYERGAFTGADRARVGRFEHADKGTIFLDEIADMSLFTQAKVLRVLQEKEFERLGSNESRKTDVRIISATNKNLVELMNQGLFREDLFYRLNVVTIRLPPLKEREGDIARLINFFVKRASNEMNKSIRLIEPEAMRILEGYHWPGNIRELENTMERAVLLAESDTITAEDLHMFFSEQAKAPTESGVRLPPEGISLEEAERQLIQQAMERSGWVQRKAAQLLGVSSRVMNYKVKLLQKDGRLQMP
jgi:two-component system, NtrC family, response regulator AtoC